MKMSRWILMLLVLSQVASTGCWCLHRHRHCGGYSRANSGMVTGCNECSNYGPEMFGTPTHGNAMMQTAGQQVDERLNPAKQAPYDPSKK